MVGFRKPVYQIWRFNIIWYFINKCRENAFHIISCIIWKFHNVLSVCHFWLAFQRQRKTNCVPKDMYGMCVINAIYGLSNNNQIQFLPTHVHRITRLDIHRRNYRYLLQYNTACIAILYLVRCSRYGIIYECVRASRLSAYIDGAIARVFGIIHLYIHSIHAVYSMMTSKVKIPTKCLINKTLIWFKQNKAALCIYIYVRAAYVCI